MLQPLEGLLGGIRLRRRKCGVQRDDGCTRSAQPINQLSVAFTREWERTDVLKRLLVDINDHDAIVVGALASHPKSQVQGALLDILEKNEACVGVTTNSGKPKKHQAEKCDSDCQPQIRSAQRKSVQPRRPPRPALFQEFHKYRDDGLAA